MSVVAYGREIQYMKSINLLSIFLMTSALMACGGGGGNASAPVPPPDTTGTTQSIASILISAVDPQIESIKADGITPAKYTVRALDAGNAVVSGATLSVSASAGLVVSPSTVTTDADGLATVSIIASAADQTNRVGTLAAACSSCAASAGTKTVVVLGAALKLTNPGGANLVVGGTGSTLSAEVKNASGVLMAGVPVTFASTDPSKVSVASATVNTDAKGIATTTIKGLAAGLANVDVTALGTVAAQSYTAGAATSALSITAPSNNTALETNKLQTISVSAPGATTVFFSSVSGTFANGAKSQGVSVTADVASADVTYTQAGTSTLDVTDNLGRKASIILKVSPPVSAANKVLLTVNQTSLPVATDQTTPTVRVRAQAVVAVGSVDQAVANVPIVFSMTGGPGGGEYLATSFQLTDSSGYAYADFYSGTAVSIANGISVGANILGTSFATGVSPSSNNVALTIGGQALSVAFGASSVLRESADKTLYLSDYSVIVTDANNNPVPNATVTLRLRPVAFSTGSFCTPTATFCSEDINANGSLDAGEDSNRAPISATTAGLCSAQPPALSATAVDGLLTPANSVGGSVPSTVLTGAGGTASFTLTYLKASSIYIVDQLTATVSASGTESSGSIIFRLAPSEVDKVVDDLGVVKKCYIPDSPYTK